MVLIPLRVLRFLLLIVIPPQRHTHLSPPHEVCDSPELEAHYHTPGLHSALHLSRGSWLASEER